MSERTRNKLLLGLIGILALALAVLLITAETPDDRVERLGTSIKCPVCQGESIADSPNPIAADMMSLIAERVESGATDEQIYSELLSSFSGAVLLDPPLSGSTLALWLLPLLALGVGITVLWWWKRHPGDSETVGPEPGTVNRRLAGGLILIGGFALIVIVASSLLQERSGPNEGAADVAIEDLEDVSNETMEAVVAANVDDPRINGMRLALAERYFEAGEYRSAFPHFLAVAQDPGATDGEATSALVRLGWMAYDGNGEVDTALSLLDEALALSPDSQAALFLKGQVLWCGANDSAAAAALFEQILDDPDLSDETRAEVDSALENARSGAECN